MACRLTTFLLLSAALNVTLAGEDKQPVFTPADAAEERLAPRSRAEIVEATTPELGVPRVSVAIDGEVFPGAWVKLTGSATGAPPKVVAWTQTAGPKLQIPESDAKRAELWLFTIQAGSYALAFKAKNEQGWSPEAVVRFAVAPGRPYVSAQDGYKLAGSGEKIVLPGRGWTQIAGPASLSRSSDQGVAVRPNDAGLYVFEASRLEGLSERRGVRVPPAKDGVLGDRRPIAKIANVITGVPGRVIELDGSLSMDPDPGETETLRAAWRTSDAARGVELEQRAGLNAAFKARKAGSYSVTLVVSDGRLESLPETVFIEIAAGRDGNETADGDVDDTSPDPNDPRLRRITLSIWPLEPLADGSTYKEEDGGLERAVQLFPRRCGAALLIDPSVARPGQFKDMPLALTAIDTPLRHFIDWAGRQTGTKYRLVENRAFWLVKPDVYFAHEELAPVAAAIDALHEKNDGSDLLTPLKEYFKSVLNSRNTSSLMYEEQRQEIVGVLPRSGCTRLKEIVASLREPAGLAVRYSEQLSAAEWSLKRRLAEKTVTAKGRYRFDKLLRDITEKTGLAIGFNPRESPKGEFFTVTVNFNETPLRQVLRDLATEAGFDGVSVEPPAGAWFYKGARPYPGAEVFCECAVVRSYDLSQIFAALSPEAAALLSGDTIAHAVRSRVYPASWNDAGTLLFYHGLTRKLLVVHTPLAQRRVQAVLNDLRDRGEWALGPSE